MRILVCGAGPTGLTLALELARRGIKADIIERRAQPSQLSRAVGLMPGSMRIFEPTGVAEAIRAQAIEVQRARFHDGSKLVATLNLTVLPDPAKRLLALAQDQTERCIQQGVERYGGKVCYNTALDGLSQDEKGVSATYNGSLHSYDYVVGCDGVRSFVRQAMNIRFEGRELDKQWSIADADVLGWDGMDSFSVYLLPGGNAAVVVPLEKARVRVIASTVDALAALPVPINVARIRRSGAFAISVRIAQTYQSGRVFLAGDAAHCHSPAGGRGMNLGIADAADLARRFAEGGLSDYTATRRAEGEAVLTFSEQGRRAVMSEGKLKRALLIGAMKLASNIPALNRVAVGRLLDF